MVAARLGPPLFFSARVKNMGAEMVLGVVIVVPLVFGAVVWRWTSEEWLQAFVILARSLGRLI
jgi:hypothetical protein